jgi:hypothetical protein
MLAPGVKPNCGHCWDNGCQYCDDGPTTWYVYQGRYCVGTVIAVSMYEALRLAKQKFDEGNIEYDPYEVQRRRR